MAMTFRCMQPSSVARQSPAVHKAVAHCFAEGWTQNTHSHSILEARSYSAEEDGGVGAYARLCVALSIASHKSNLVN